jgi:UDP-glucose 4-epimerase
MQVLVLGGNGFIGSHVVDALLAAGHAVRVLSRRPEAFRPPLAGVTYLAGDLSDQVLLLQALDGVEAVFHLAGSTVPATAEADPVADVQSNLIGTLGLLQAMERAGVRRLVYLSSGGTVYGVPEVTPVPETHLLRPVGSYGIVKVAIEHYLAREVRSGLLPVVIRASNPYGPRQSGRGIQGFISAAMTALLRGTQVEIWGDGSVVRDYLHVQDLAALCLHGLSATGPVTVNGGSGRGLSLRAVLAALEQVTGQEIRPTYRPGRAVDVPVSVLDVTRAREVFGWQPRIALEDGLAQTWDWMRART